MIHTFANVLCGSLKTGGEKRGGSLNLVLEACQSGPSISKRGIMAHKDRRKDKATKLRSEKHRLLVPQLSGG